MFRKLLNTKFKIHYIEAILPAKGFVKYFHDTARQMTLSLLQNVAGIQWGSSLHFQPADLTLRVHAHFGF